MAFRSRSRSRSRNRLRGSMIPRPCDPHGGSHSDTDEWNDDELGFSVQLAQGSETQKIGLVRSVKDLHAKICAVFPEVKPEDILYITMGTAKPDVTKMTTGLAPLNSLLFVHVKGQKYEIEVKKESKFIGLTISDNGNGKCYVKVVKPESTAAKLIRQGMHIECINDTNVVGLRHYNVADMLRAIAIGETVRLRLIAPLESAFSALEPRSKLASSKNVINGTKTLRFKHDGTAVVLKEDEVQTANDISANVISSVNNIFEEYLGFSDEELSRSVCEIALKCKTPFEMSCKIKESDLSKFSLPDELVFDMFGLCSDLSRSARAAAPKIAT